jgi:hypothetical protein
MSATLTLTRTGIGIGIGPWIDKIAGEWQVIVDGTVAGSIARQETVEVPIEPGRHTLRIKTSRRFHSPERSFEAADETDVRFHCRSAMFWPVWLAALVKPDLWISLKQE